MEPKEKYWKLPPAIKVYEALGAIGDGRIEMDKDGAKVFSSSRNKFYAVSYDPADRAIMANDNGSYWQGYLGYPAIAYFMRIGEIKFDLKYSAALKDIKWKDINTKYKNDYAKTISHVNEVVSKRGIAPEELESEVGSILEEIKNANYKILGEKIKPPSGY